MVYNMDKPSDNMLLSTYEIAQMQHEQQMKLYNEERDKKIAEQSAYNRDIQHYLEEVKECVEEEEEDINERCEKLNKVKEGFLSECLYKLFTESYATPMNKRDKIVARNLVNRFIIENGAGNLISSFATKNMLLSEFSRICTKYYDKVVESGYTRKDNDECNDCYQIGGEVIDPAIVDDFYKELVDVDTDDATKLIKNRVADAISDFIDDNNANKIEYEDIINQAQDKVAAIDASDNKIAESYINMAKQTINEMKNTRDRNVFDYIVESLTKAVFKDDALKARFIHEASVDMDGIVGSAQIIYTMLEMVNTTNMANVNEEFITNYLSNL